MIKAPYNFVPVSDYVFFPSWSDIVSHDIPFRDGESGLIEIEITALSPIFIRDSEDNTKFCNVDGKYYIPGSSLRGMIRNVLEIMSFSKMNFVDDKTFSVRDLQNADLYRNKFKPQNIYAGWLRKTDKGYVIEDQGHPGRISHKEIDKVLGIDFSGKFSKDFGGTENEKTAQYKYNLAGDNLVHKFRYLKKNKQGQEVYGHIDTKDKGKVKEGTLVFTGQPTRRQNTGKQGDGKGFEFIFFDIQNVLPITDEQFEKFKFAYFDGRKTQPKESEDWKYWKKRLYKGERVPVFFRKNEKGEVEDFGLSMLYKLPYRHSIHDGLPPMHREIAKIPDLSETIFGFIDAQEEDNSLKGRVFIGHAPAITPAQEDRTRTLILGTPRASYYPNYIEQKVNNLYKTYMDDNFRISGWKRYPIHKNDPSVENVPEQSNVTTTFTPLKKGVKFKSTIRFHNLKPAELGGLLSALTFHNTKECKHAIGLAKAYGFGKINLKVVGGYSLLSNGEKVEFANEKTMIDYMARFEELMEGCIKNWHSSEQLKELCTMASEQGTPGILQYMKLSEFAKKKATGYDTLEKKHFLNKYSTIEGIRPIYPRSLIDSNKKYECKSKSLEEIFQKDLEYVKRNIEEDNTLLEKLLKKYPNKKQLISQEVKAPSTEPLLKQYEKIDLFFDAIMHEGKIDRMEKFLEAYPTYPKIDEIKAKIAQLHQQEEERKRQQIMANEWKKIEESEDLELLRKFVKKYPKTEYAKKAEDRIEQIEKKIRAEEERKKKAEEAKKRAQSKSRALGAAFLAIQKKNKRRK